MTDEEMDEFLQIYLEESKEETEQLAQLLLQLEQQPDDMETLREAFRLLHTFKGSSGMMGYDRINGLAHELETRFDACRNRRQRLTSETVSATLACLDFFREFLSRLESGNDDQGDPQPLLEQLAELAIVPLLEAESKPGESETHADTESVSRPADTDDDQEHPHELQPIVPSAAVEDAGPVHEVTISVRMSDHIELPELKARLIIARLQAQGEIIGIDPPLERIDQTAPPITLRVCVRTTAEESILVESIDVEGVAAAYVADDGLKPTLTGESSRKILTPPADAEIQQDAKQPDVSPPSVPGKTSLMRGETVRVSIERLDRLMNLAGELVVTNARFDQLAGEIRMLFRRGGSITADSPLAQSLLRALGDEELQSPSEIPASIDLSPIGGDGEWAAESPLRGGWMERGRKVAGQVSETVDQLARLSRSIQQAVLETRMVPIGPLFNRFRRTIRDLSLKQGKQILLDLEGEATELDKRMVDELGDPMVHLIRNAVDHGIESAQKRIASGKPAEGLIRLSAFHQSNHVIIEITDDGAGVDVEKVRRRAAQRGLAGESELKEMPDHEVLRFIWHAGFSTADRLSDISGRGVGMDVVRDRIAALGGAVELTSSPGAGSTVTIRLPLTLAIVNALIVRFRGLRLAIPVTDVYEIFGVSRADVFEAQGRNMIDVRGKLLPLYRLDEIFQWNQSLPSPAPRTDTLVHAVLVRDGHRCLAVEVDDLEGNHDIVIKPLGEHFRDIEGLGGACVMGDGQVCLVLDTAALTSRNLVQGLS